MRDSILPNSMMAFYVFDPIVCDGFSNPLRKRDREQKKNRSIGKNWQEKVWKMFTDGYWILFFWGLWTKERRRHFLRFIRGKFYIRPSIQQADGDQTLLIFELHTREFYWQNLTITKSAKNKSRFYKVETLFRLKSKVHCRILNFCHRRLSDTPN